MGRSTGTRIIMEITNTSSGWQKYILAFLISSAIFATAFYAAAKLNSGRIADIRAMEESISIDLLSTETQFELLGGLDCKTIKENPVLSSELDSLAQRLSFTESNLGINNAEVIRLKKQYSLLEIKDYLLMQRIAEKCQTKPVFILYFYSNAGDCEDCARSGEVLTYMSSLYPDLRVYAFDYNLDLSALQTLIKLRKVESKLPAFVINDRSPVYGFKSFDEMQNLIPELKTLATSTPEN